MERLKTKVHAEINICLNMKYLVAQYVNRGLLEFL